MSLVAKLACRIFRHSLAILGLCGSLSLLGSLPVSAPALAGDEPATAAPATPPPADAPASETKPDGFKIEVPQSPAPKNPVPRMPIVVTIVTTITLVPPCFASKA